MRRPLVVDSSGLLSMLLGEEDAARITRARLDSQERCISAFNALETSIVIEARKGPGGRVSWQALAQQLRLVIVPRTSDHVRIAHDAWRRFGKGRHSAGLNPGDCCAYALARYSGFPLLAKGKDFPRTDVDLLSY